MLQQQNRRRKKAMTKAGKLVKDLMKAKKESVMGKLGDSPYEDPMEPWSAKYAQPVKEEAEQLDESDPLLFKYIRSLGYNPEQMDFASRSKYARSNAFKNYKISHMNDQLRNEEVEELDEAGTGLLMSFIKAKGLNPLSMDGNQKKAYSRSSEFRLFKNRHVSETSGMGERGDDWNEASSPAQQAAIAINMQKKGIKPKKVQEEADAKDTVCFDIPLLIRVLEFTREDMKTDIELHNMVERLIDMRHNVPLTMEHYDAITGKLKEEVEPIQELKASTLDSYITKVSTGPSRGVTPKGTLKSIKAIGGVTKAIRKKAEKPLSELKKQDDNMEIDDRITREEKKMKGADPCWTGYQMVGTKKKGGRTVPNCVPEEVVQEGIGGIEDSPMSATNSVKAMESEQRKKNMKSARIIKSIYKKKGKNESMYDWEKDDKPNAKITLQGGTTMTGQPRDTVEIEPVLKTRPNSQKQ